MPWREIPLLIPPCSLGTLLSPYLGPKARELAAEVLGVAGPGTFGYFLRSHRWASPVREERDQASPWTLLVGGEAPLSLSSSLWVLPSNPW